MQYAVHFVSLVGAWMVVDGGRRWLKLLVTFFRILVCVISRRRRSTDSTVKTQNTKGNFRTIGYSLQTSFNASVDELLLVLVAIFFLLNVRLFSLHPGGRLHERLDFEYRHTP
jgi:uncharacterized membrane protein